MIKYHLRVIEWIKKYTFFLNLNQGKQYTSIFKLG
jgi:hypothetical protein